MSRSDNKWLIPVFLAAGIAIALIFFWPRFTPMEPEPAAIDPDPVAEEKLPRPVPLHPLEPLESSGRSDRELVPLPALDDSDAYFRLELVDLFGSRLDELLVNEALIEKFVATIDNLPRKRVAERVRPVGRLQGNFVVGPGAAAGAYRLSEENFDRYRVLVDMLAFADVGAIEEAYRRYYPLMQDAYLRLGYPDAYFNDRVVEVIDHLLATPEPEGSIELVRPHVLYEFADPQLEALSGGQKLLLRMGEDNAARAKAVLVDLRTRIAAE